MQTVTLAQLETGLAKLATPTFIGLTAEVVPEMVKKDRETKEPNPYLGRVTKISNLTGIVGFRYENSVNNQRVRESDTDSAEALEALANFVALPRKWGTHIDGTPLIEHKGAKYLEVKVQNAFATTYTLDGVSATLEQLESIKRYLPLAKPEGVRQEVVNPVILRDYALTSIRAVRMLGDEFRVI